jgi:PKD repeat protein
MLRLAFMETADNANTPNNDYGWGLINMADALNWGARFEADIQVGTAPLTVNFTDLSPVPASSYTWYFGDGSTSNDINPTYMYDQAGLYDVTLSLETEYGTLTNMAENYVFARGDTLRFDVDSVFAGESVVTSFYLTNSIPIKELWLPFVAGDSPIDLALDSTAFGDRTSHFEFFDTTTWSSWDNRYNFHLVADTGGGALPLPPGSGEIVRVYWSTDPWGLSDQTNVIDSTDLTFDPMVFISEEISYLPEVVQGMIKTIDVDRGDLNFDGKINLADITKMIDFVYVSKEPPITLRTADVTDDLKVNLGDITTLINFVYISKDPPLPDP